MKLAQKASFWYLACAFQALLLWMAAAQAKAEESQELVIDAVLASVDGKPITLLEVCDRLVPPRRLSLKEASLDLEARRILTSMIMESLIEAEAATRKLKVSEEELGAYLDEVARRNQLSRQGFEEELQRQGGSLEAYRQHVRIEILRSKIIGQLIHTAPAVTKAEMEQYLKDHPELSKAGTKTKMRQIFLGLENRNPAEVQARMEDLINRIRNGEDFGALATRHSEGREAPEGGSLGVVALEDLSPAVFDAVFPLKEGEISAVVSTPDGLRIFQIEKLYLDREEHDPALLADIQSALARQKQESAIQSFFETEITKLHVVDKKI